jgi:hypothetical protein
MIMTDMSHIDVPSDATGEGSGYWYRRGYSDAMADQPRRFYAVKIETKNTAEGNPRRGWLIYDSNSYLVGFADENYRSNGALHNAAAILAGHELEAHEVGGQSGAGYDGQGGSWATGPKGTVRISILCVLSVTPGEYRTAKKHGAGWGDTARQF